MDVIYETPVIGARNQHVKRSFSVVDSILKVPVLQPVGPQDNAAEDSEDRQSIQEFRSINSSFDPFASERSHRIM